MGNSGRAKWIKCIEDKTGVRFGDLVNVVVLFTSLVAIYFAVKSYNVAIESLRSSAISGAEQQRVLFKQYSAVVISGTEQQKVLETSRKSLESVVSISKVQQQLLSENLKASQTQLTIIQEQRRRELERPNFFADLFSPHHLAIKFYSHPKYRSASYITFEGVAITLDRTINNANEHFVSYTMRPTTINPLSAGSHPIPFDFGAFGYPGTGNRIFGYLSAECPECEPQKRIYWFACYDPKQDECWFHEGTLQDYPTPIQDYPAKIESHDIVKKFLGRPNLRRIVDY